MRGNSRPYPPSGSRTHHPGPPAGEPREPVRRKPGTLQVASTYIGTVVGAGFASGQEAQRLYPLVGYLGLVILGALAITAPRRGLAPAGEPAKAAGGRQGTPAPALGPLPARAAARAATVLGALLGTAALAGRPGRGGNGGGARRSAKLTQLVKRHGRPGKSA